MAITGEHGNALKGRTARAASRRAAQSGAGEGLLCATTAIGRPMDAGEWSQRDHFHLYGLAKRAFALDEF